MTSKSLDTEGLWASGLLNWACGQVNVILWLKWQSFTMVLLNKLAI